MAEEGVTQKAIIDTLRAMGYRVIRHNGGRRGHQSLGMGRGTPDLYVPVQILVPHSGVTRDMRKIARAVWLEVKASKGKRSNDQIAWAKAGNDNGEYVVTVRSVDEAIEHVKRAQDGLPGPTDAA